MNKSFTKYMAESEDGSEFIVKILIRGTDDAFMECHDKCQWLDKTDTQPKCILFKNTLKLKEDDNVSHPLRSPNCLSTTDSLT